MRPFSATQPSLRECAADPGVSAVIRRPIDLVAAEAGGVQAAGALTITSALHGLVRDDPRAREEFLSLTGGRGR